ncbi:hypothetical protein BPAE_0110g00250 [Botrytis paeoniae]|uniref:Uncharacterized protein n=1 Tax=Botrytis paeoniae TaxID=278948 RepID=A0A4Z1FR48_9HELO|nr:hypothetical protein BPAE_0110g00250 [Botrytis paeoniae]
MYLTTFYIYLRFSSPPSSSAVQAFFVSAIQHNYLHPLLSPVTLRVCVLALSFSSVFLLTIPEITPLQIYVLFFSLVFPNPAIAGCDLGAKIFFLFLHKYFSKDMSSGLSVKGDQEEFNDTIFKPISLKSRGATRYHHDFGLRQLDIYTTRLGTLKSSPTQIQLCANQISGLRETGDSSDIPYAVTDS